MEVFAFEHYHPMILELAVEVAQLFHCAPRTLNDLMPFLEPNAVVDFFEKALSTFIPWLIKTFAPQVGLDGTTLEFKGNPSPQNTSYIYDLTPMKDSRIYSIDGAREYAGFFGFIFSGLLGQIAIAHRKLSHLPKVQKSVQSFLDQAKLHYLKHEKEQWVKSEHARATVLQKFVTEELQRNKQYLSRLSMLNGSLVGLKGLELVLALNREKSNETIREELVSFLERRRAQYHNIKFSSLTREFGDLSQKIEEDKKSGCDISYAKAPIPDDILGFVDLNFG